MFSKNSKGSSRDGGRAPAGPVRAAVPSIISTDLRVVGDLSSDGEIQVDGAIDGDIRTRVLLVGETAHIKGEVIADSVRVHGHVNGQIKANSVSLAATAHVVGDILHENLSIDKGAYLEGHCRRMNERLDLSEGAGKMNLLLREGEAAALPAPEKV
jgi:cytoskeletal protein CcmA (bactofilin family)